MTALSVAGRRDDVRSGATIHVWVTDAARAPELVDFLDGLGLHAIGEPGGLIRIRCSADVEWRDARFEIERSVDSWVREHGVPVQLS